MSTREGIRLLLVFSCALAVPGCLPEPTAPGRPGDRLLLDIKGRKLTVEVSCDDLSRRRGLQDREHLAEDAGMLFVFPRDERQDFWMKSTLIPLSIAFLDLDGKILQIEDMKPHDESNTTSNSKVRFAVEVNKGWFQKNGIGVGDAFSDFSEKVRIYRQG
jgi:uncharacterized protein